MIEIIVLVKMGDIFLMVGCRPVSMFDLLLLYHIKILNKQPQIFLAAVYITLSSYNITSVLTISF